MSWLYKDRPKRLWHGKKRLAKEFLGRHYDVLKWAVSISPGDWIATCEGCNRQVANIEYHWVNEGYFRRGKPNRTRVLYEVIFTDTHGIIHYCPGGGCALPKETLKEIRDYHILRLLGTEPGKMTDTEQDMWDRLNSDRHIVDENGEYLPEFDRHR